MYKKIEVYRTCVRKDSVLGMTIRGGDFRRCRNLPHQPRHQISHLHLRNNPLSRRSSSLMRRMSSDVIPSGGLSMYFLRSISVFWFICAVSFEKSIPCESDFGKSCGRPSSTRTGHGFLVHFFQRYALMVKIKF